MGIRTNVKQKKKVPGPGTYNPDVSFTKQNMMRGGKIGPGKSKNTKGGRSTSFNPSQNPGPGSYDVRTKPNSGGFG